MAHMVGVPRARQHPLCSTGGQSSSGSSSTAPATAPRCRHPTAVQHVSLPPAPLQLAHALHRAVPSAPPPTPPAPDTALPGAPRHDHHAPCSGMGEGSLLLGTAALLQVQGLRPQPSATSAEGVPGTHPAAAAPPPPPPLLHRTAAAAGGCAQQHSGGVEGQGDIVVRITRVAASAAAPPQPDTSAADITCAEVEPQFASRLRSEVNAKLNLQRQYVVETLRSVKRQAAAVMAKAADARLRHRSYVAWRVWCCGRAAAGGSAAAASPDPPAALTLQRRKVQRSAASEPLDTMHVAPPLGTAGPGAVLLGVRGGSSSSSSTAGLTADGSCGSCSPPHRSLSARCGSTPSVSCGAHGLPALGGGAAAALPTPSPAPQSPVTLEGFLDSVAQCGSPVPPATPHSGGVLHVGAHFRTDPQVRGATGGGGTSWCQGLHRLTVIATPVLPAGERMCRFAQLPVPLPEALVRRALEAGQLQYIETLGANGVRHWQSHWEDEEMSAQGAALQGRAMKL